MLERISELRRRRRSILDTALEIEQARPPAGALPPEEAARIDALIPLLDWLGAEIDRLEAKWNAGVIACDFRSLTEAPDVQYRIRLADINERERPVTQDVIDAYTKAFGAERAPEMWLAMKDGC